MNWILKLLQLVPIIAQGVHMFHSGAPLETKTALAQDSLTLAIAGAKVLAPSQSSLIDGVGGLASQTLNDTVTALHNGTAVPA